MFSILDPSKASYRQFEQILQVSLGQTPLRQIIKLGINTDQDKLEDIILWPPGTALALQAAVVTVAISSSAAADTAKTGTLYYLDGSYLEKTKAFTTNAVSGRTETTIGVTDCLRVNNVILDAVCAGDFYVYDTSDTVTDGVPDTLATKCLAMVPLGYQQPRQLLYTIPATHYGFLREVRADAKTPSATFDLHCYSKLLAGAPTLLANLTATAGNTAEFRRFDPVMPLLQPKTDVYCKSENSSADNSSVTGEMELWTWPIGKVG
jgi:hypothetical protein